MEEKTLYLNINYQSNIHYLATWYGNILKGWVKLNLYYLGESKKNRIFRTTSWNRGRDERVFRKTVYNEKYEKIGYIKEIFGPLSLPFISIKTIPGQEFNPKSNLYVKV